VVFFFWSLYFGLLWEKEKDLSTDEKNITISEIMNKKVKDVLYLMKMSTSFSTKLYVFDAQIFCFSLYNPNGQRYNGIVLWCGGRLPFYPFSTPMEGENYG